MTATTDTDGRLIVAADFGPGEEDEVLELAQRLDGLGVIIKVNSVLRRSGYELIDVLHQLGVRVFADLKLNDIPATMRLDAKTLADYGPDILTVMCSAGVDGMRAVAENIGDETEVLGVTVLTSLDEEQCQGIYACSTKAGVLRFARMAKLAELDGLILSPKEVEVVSKRPELEGLTINTPGIRPEGTVVKDDDQARVLTPRKAMELGIHRIVVGRVITQTEKPRRVTEAILAEMAEGLAATESEEG